MATIDVRKGHTLSKDEARQRAEVLARSMEEKLDLQWHWEGDRIVFEAPKGVAKGTKGTVDVSDKEVRVQIDLPLMMRMLKGTVEARVNEKLGQLL